MPDESLDTLNRATLGRLTAVHTSHVTSSRWANQRYPAALIDTADPPLLLLYAQGHFDLLQSQAVAIVGSRSPTPQGSDNARAFARHPAPHTVWPLMA
jgi:DNA processing protein